MELWLVAFLVKFFFNEAQIIARLDSAYENRFRHDSDDP
jgi:hypothetical protein